MSAPPTTIVAVVLRGGADGLALVPPDDSTYRALRPSLSMERPLRLDGAFGLHPALGALLPAFRAGELAVVHAVGSDDDTRSHFDAQERMERAGARSGSEPSGWLARHLRTRRGAAPSTLGAVVVGSRIPDGLASAPAVAVVQPGEDVVVPRGADDRALRRALAALHSGGGPVERAGRDALEALGRLARVRRDGSRAASYGDHAFGRALHEVARLVRADVGLEVASVDLDGWDTHFAQASAIEPSVRALAEGLCAFRADLAERMEHVVVVVMTEFGRRAYENAALGTDHGRASVMLLLGGGVRGGRVVTRWPGLDPASLEPPGDLRVTIDYRDVLGELVGARLGNARVAEVFPGWDVRGVGVFGRP